MNRKTHTVLAVICLACTLTLVSEWFYSAWQQKKALNSSVAIKETHSLDVMPVIDLLKQSEENYQDLSTRPLFIKGRRAVIEPSKEAPQNIQITANTFDWQLNGVYTTANGLTALLSRAITKGTKTRYRKLIVGAEIDGWKLTEIKKDRVLFEQNNLSKELLLQKSKPKELSNNPNTPIIPAAAPDAASNPPIADVPNPFNPFTAPNNPQPAVGGFEIIDHDNQ